jgi:hypothetical protein
LIFCSISIFLLASPVAGKKPQWTAVADYQGMYPTIPIHWNIKSAPASLGRSRAGPAFYVFSFLGWWPSDIKELLLLVICDKRNQWIEKWLLSKYG